jgi:hypothetical protein
MSKEFNEEQAKALVEATRLLLDQAVNERVPRHIADKIEIVVVSDQNEEVE